MSGRQEEHAQDERNRLEMDGPGLAAEHEVQWHSHSDREESEEPPRGQSDVDHRAGSQPRDPDGGGYSQSGPESPPPRFRTPPGWAAGHVCLHFATTVD